MHSLVFITYFAFKVQFSEHYNHMHGVLSSCFLSQLTKEKKYVIILSYNYLHTQFYWYSFWGAGISTSTLDIDMEFNP
jgi:hypothetical protein